MNLLILHNEEVSSDGQIVLTDRRADHLREILDVTVGQEIKIGVLNGQIGSAKVTNIQEKHIELSVIKLDQTPPPQLPLTLILALPRPRMLQRTLQTIATMGVEKLCLIQSSRVEKSFWQTPLLQPEKVKEQLILGLEQARATQLPIVEYHKRFRPFMEDELDSLTKDKAKFIAHPGDYPYPSKQQQKPSVLAIGPEGGFIEKEVSNFLDHDFQGIQLGRRILRVETAVPVLLAKLYD